MKLSILLEVKSFAKVVTFLEKRLLIENHKFIRVSFMQALAELALKHKWLRNEVIGLIEEEMVRGSAAIKA